MSASTESQTVNFDRVEKAFAFLSETDRYFAELKTNVKRAEYLLKRKEAQAYLSCEGSVKERESRARTDPDVTAAYDAHTDAMVAHEELAAQRETAGLLIDLWRSYEASRRVGGL